MTTLPPRPPGPETYRWLCCLEERDDAAWWLPVTVSWATTLSSAQIHALLHAPLLHTAAEIVAEVAPYDLHPEIVVADRKQWDRLFERAWTRFAPRVAPEHAWGHLMVILDAVYGGDR